MVRNLKKQTPNNKDRGYLITGKAPKNTLGIFHFLYHRDTEAIMGNYRKSPLEGVFL